METQDYTIKIPVKKNYVCTGRGFANNGDFIYKDRWKVMEIFQYTGKEQDKEMSWLYRYVEPQAEQILHTWRCCEDDKPRENNKAYLLRRKSSNKRKCNESPPEKYFYSDGKFLRHGTMILSTKHYEWRDDSNSISMEQTLPKMNTECGNRDLSKKDIQHTLSFLSLPWDQMMQAQTLKVNNSENKKVEEVLDELSKRLMEINGKLDAYRELIDYKLDSCTEQIFYLTNESHKVRNNYKDMSMAVNDGRKALNDHINKVEKELYAYKEDLAALSMKLYELKNKTIRYGGL